MKELVLSPCERSAAAPDAINYGDIVRERRHSDRKPDNQNVAIFNHRIKQICGLLNLSVGGASLKLSHGTVPALHEPIALLLLDGTAVPAIVRWTKADTIGLEFLKPLSEPDHHLVLETLGQQYYGKAIEIQRHFHSSSPNSASNSKF